MTDELREETAGVHGDVDDVTFLAIERLNNPDIIAAFEMGQITCQCRRCQRTRRALAAERIEIKADVVNAEFTIVPDESASRAARKATPVATGVLSYFPTALLEVAAVSKVGNDQHNPGEPLHWAREKSTDEADALARHLLDFLRGDEYDTDGLPHLAKVAWRALALLERWCDNEYRGGYHS